MRDDYHAFALLRFRHSIVTTEGIPIEVMEAELPAALKLVAAIRADAIEECVREIDRLRRERTGR